jgi:hypothetical protein
MIEHEKRPCQGPLGNLRKKSLSLEGFYGEAIRNSAIAYGVELLALGQALVIGLHFRRSVNGKGSYAKNGEQKAQGSKLVKHDSRGW